MSKQLPTTPPRGNLEQVAGLLLARAAPGDRAVRRALLTHWGLDDLAQDKVLVCHARTRAAYLRLLKLAAETGPPAPLLEALSISGIADRDALRDRLREGGLSEGSAGQALVEGLAQVYRLARSADTG